MTTQMNSSGMMPKFRGKPNSWRHAKSTLGLILHSVRLEERRNGPPKALCGSLIQFSLVLVHEALIYPIDMRSCNGLMTVKYLL